MSRRQKFDSIWQTNAIPQMGSAQNHWTVNQRHALKELVESIPQRFDRNKLEEQKEPTRVRTESTPTQTFGIFSLKEIWLENPKSSIYMVYIFAVSRVEVKNLEWQI